MVCRYLRLKIVSTEVQRYIVIKGRVEFLVGTGAELAANGQLSVMTEISGAIGKRRDCLHPAEVESVDG